MNSEEVLVLIRHAAKRYMDPETIRPSETIEEASLRQCANIRELLEELRRYLFTTATGAAAMANKNASSKVPPPLANSNAFHEVCLSTAQTFLNRRQYREGLHACLNIYHASRGELDDYAAEERARFERGGKMAALLLAEEDNAVPAAVNNNTGVQTTQNKNSSTNVASLDAATDVMHRHQALLMTKVCQFFLVLEADPHVEGSGTSAALEKAVDDMIADMQDMLPENENLYFLIFNATLMVFQCCQELMRLSFHALAAPYLAYCGRLMDAVLPLATVKFLPWRLRLYGAVALCYEAMHEYRAAHKIASHALKVAEDLHDLETSDVVPPSKDAMATLQKCLLDARLAVQRYNWKAVAVEAAAAGAAGGPSSQEAAGSKKGGGAKGGAASIANAAAAGGDHGSVPSTHQELTEAVRVIVRGNDVGQLPLVQQTRKVLDHLTALAMDHSSRWMPLPAGTYANKPYPVPSDSDPVASRDLPSASDPLKMLAADAVAAMLGPMAELFLKTHPAVVEALGWNPPGAGDEGRPTTADTGSEAPSAGTAGKKGAKPTAKKAAPSAAPASPAGAKPSPGAAAIDETVLALDAYVLQAAVSPRDMCFWIKTQYVSNADLAPEPFATNHKASPPSLSPTPFHKLLVVILEILRSPAYGALFPSDVADLKTSIMVQNPIITAAAMELSLVLAMSKARRACGGTNAKILLAATTPSSSSLESASTVAAAQLACVDLATAVNSALQETNLLQHVPDLVEDAARLLLSCWRYIPFPSEAEGAEQVYSVASVALMTVGYPDALTIGNCALTASRLLQAQHRNPEALVLVRKVEAFLARRQGEFVFNHNAWTSQQPKKGGEKDPIMGEVLHREHAATLHGGMWLRTIRDIRTLLVQHLASLRLAVAAANLHEQTIQEHERKASIMKTREAQSHLFGELSRKERRVMTLLESVAIEPPTTAEDMERKLSAWAVGVDATHAAVVWIEIAKRQPDAQKKKDRLRKAAEYLEAAQRSYEVTYRALTAESKGAGSKSVPPAGGGGGFAVMEPPPLQSQRPGTAPSEFASAASAVGGGGGSLHLNVGGGGAPQSNLVTPRTHQTAAGAAAGGDSQSRQTAPLSPRTQFADDDDSSLHHNGGGSPVDVNDATEVTTARGLSVYLAWALYIDACAVIDAKELSRPFAEDVIVNRYVVRGNGDAAVWNGNPFAMDVLHQARCNASSSYMCIALGRALSVVADARAADTPYTPDGKLVDDDEAGFDTRRNQLRAVQKNFARCGNIVLLGLELATAANDQRLMVLLCHQVFNCVLPQLIAKRVSIVALRPLTMLFNVMVLFEPRRWNDGPLQYLAARSIRAALSIAQQLSSAAQRPVLQAALAAFQHVWPLVLTHPNVRQIRHMEAVVDQIQYVDRVLNAKFKKPAPAEGTSAEASAASAKAPASKAAAKAPPKAAAAAAAAAAADAAAGNTSLYFRSELFFDDFMPVEYLELLDVVLFKTPGGAALCELMETKFVASQLPPPPGTPSATTAAAAQNASAGEEAPPRRLVVRRDSKSLFPHALLNAAVMLSSNIHANTIVAKLLEGKAADPYFAKVASAVALELVSRRLDEQASLLCHETVKEIIARHDAISGLQKESQRLLRESLQALGHYTAPGNQDASAAQAQSMHTRLLQKMSRRISEIRRRFAFKRLRAWYLQYDVPFQALLHLIAAVSCQREAEREKARMQLLASQGTTPPSAQNLGGSASLASNAAPSAAAQPKTPAKSSKAGDSANSSLGAALASGMTNDERLQQHKEDTIKHTVKAVVLFNRCYRVQYAYVTVQFYVNAMRTLFAVDPPSSLTDVLQQARMADHGGAISSRSAGSAPSQSFHLTLAQANTKPVTESIAKVETPCKVVANEIIKLLRIFEEGHVNAATEVECLQPVSVKIGEDCLPGKGIMRRSTTLQMWLTDEGLFEEKRREMQDEERRFIRERVYERERNEFGEMEQWERLNVIKTWAKEYFDIIKASTTNGGAGEDSDADAALVESLYQELKTGSSRHSQTTEGGSHSTRAAPSGGPAITNALRTKKPTAKVRIAAATTTAATTSPAPDDATPTGQIGYQPIAFEARLGKHINLEELMRCFGYVVRCLQYGQRKQSAVAITLEMNDLTLNHYATLLLPYALNLQSAMGLNTEKTMLRYLAGHREVVRTKKLIHEAHRVLAVYKESDAYRRAQIKLATSLQPSRRGITTTTIQDSDAVSVGTSATGGGTHGGGGGGSAYKEVVSAFNAAISYLRQKHSTLLLVGVLFELGHLHLHHRVRVEAERCWNDVVDAAFSSVNTLKHWRSLLEGLQDGDQELLERLGVHKALMSAAALSSLAMFSYHENQKKATEASILAAEILRALVASGNLAAPQRAWDHAPFTARELFVNVELDTVYSEFMPTIVSGLLYSSHHLCASGYPLHCIYIANVAEFLAVKYLRARESTVYARLLKVKAAAAASDFRSAFAALESVVLGRNLPDSAGGVLGITIDVADVDAKNKGQVDGGGSVGGGGAGGKKDAAAKAGAKAAVTKGGAPEEAAGGGGGDAGTTIGGIPPLYDNSKPPNHPDNAKAVEAIVSLAFPAMAPTSTATTPSVPSAASVALSDVISAEYGAPLVRQILMAIGSAMLSLASSDAASAWQAAGEGAEAAAAAAAAAGQGSKKGEKKDGAAKGGAAQASSNGAASSSAIATALLVAESVALCLGQCKSGNLAARPSVAAPATAAASPAQGGGKANAKDTAAMAAASAAAALPPASISAHVSPVEETFLRHQVALLSAQIATMKGDVADAARTLRLCIANHNSEESYTLSVANVPSYLMATTGRFLCEVYILLGKSYLWLRQWTNALDAVTYGAQIAEHCADTFAQRELLFVKLVAMLRQGVALDALDVVAQLVKHAKSLEFRGSDPFYPNAVVMQHTLHVAMVEDPRLHNLQVLVPTYDAGVNAKTRELLSAAMSLLYRRAQDLGLNVAVSAATTPTVVNAQTTNVYELHHAVNSLASLTMRCNLLDDAVVALRFGLDIATQYDTTRMPQEVIRSKLLLAVALRQRHAPPQDGSSSSQQQLGHKLFPSERPLSSGMVPQHDDDLIAFFASGHHADVREMVSLLVAVITENITVGLHDYETLRIALGNLALITMPFPQLCLVTANLIALASAVASMEATVNHNTAAFGATPPVTAENPSGGMGLPGELPAAVVAVVEEFVRRDGRNQSKYLQGALEASLGYQAKLNSAGGQSAAAAGGKPAGAPAATSAVPSASTQQPAVTIPFSAVVSSFIGLLNERDTTLPAQRVALDNLLTSLRKYLQTKAHPFSLAGLNTLTADGGSGGGAPPAAPWCVFDKPPRLTPSPVAPPAVQQSSPLGAAPPAASLWFPKANYVFAQNIVANTSTVSHEEVEGELKPTYPYLSMLLCVSAVHDPDAAPPPAYGADAAAAGGGGKNAPGGGKQPPPGKAGAPSQAGGGATAHVVEEAVVAMPILMHLAKVPQAALKAIHTNAKAILRKQTLFHETAIQLDDVLSEALAAAGAVAGKDAAGGGKKAAAAAKGPEGGGGGDGTGNALTAAAATGLTPRFAPRHTGPDDEAKADVLLSFVDLFVNAACGEAAPKQRDAFYPIGNVTLDHIAFIAAVTNIDGGCACMHHLDVHRWALRLVLAVQDTLAAAAASN